MRILVIEDQDDKFGALEEEIQGFFQNGRVKIDRAVSLLAADKSVYETKYELIVIDLMMPLRGGDAPEDISDEIITTIEMSDNNRGANIIALSGYEDLVGERRSRFVEAGMLLVHFDRDGEAWRKHLRMALSRIQQQVVFDFIIVCALDKERAAFRRVAAVNLGELRNIRGLDCLSIEISGLQGVCIKLPQMGLVNASIVTSRAIERFSPKIVAMSGICAGAGGESKVGTLIVADPCWEYQTGKWADDGFKFEHYDVPLEANTRTTIEQFIDRVGKGSEYKNDLIEDKVVFESIKVAPMATGSAVVASKERLSLIEGQHRKIAAVDMEMYGVYKAGHLSPLRPIVFGAKTVVDLANSAKGDKYHEYGAILSARFVSDVIKELHQHLMDELSGLSMARSD